MIYYIVILSSARKKRNFSAPDFERADDDSVQVKLNNNALGFSTGTEAIDAETNIPLTVKNSLLVIGLPGLYGTKLIRI